MRIQHQPVNGHPEMGVVNRAFTWYARHGDHPAKLRIVDWLKALLRVRVVIAPTRAGWMKLDLLDFAQRALFLYGVYEPETFALITRLLKSGDCFVDIGANVGQYSLAASRIVGANGTVVAIEADPTNFQQLLFNFEINHVHNVVPILGAANAKPDFLPFSSPDVNKGIAHVVRKQESTNGSFLVCGFETASLLQAQGITSASVVKLDIEGHEFPALRGLLENVARLPSHIVFELRQGLSNDEQINEQVLDYLRQKGYEICLIDGSRFERNMNVPESNLWARLI